MMKNRNFTKIVCFFAVILSTFYYGDPTPPNPGGAGAVGPGAPATPIDMFIIPLAVVAFFVIVYFARKRKLS